MTVIDPFRTPTPDETNVHPFALVPTTFEISDPAMGGENPRNRNAAKLEFGADKPVLGNNNQNQKAK